MRMAQHWGRRGAHLSENKGVKNECKKIFEKIQEYFGRDINGTLFISTLKFSGRSGPPPELALFDQLVRSDLKLPLHLEKSRLQCQFAEM